MASATAPADFDETALADLEGALPRAEFELLLNDYLASSAERLARVAALGTARNLKDLAFEAHTLISTSGSYGLNRAAIIARNLERACKSGSADEAAALLSEFREAAACGCAALRARFLVRAPGSESTAA